MKPRYALALYKFNTEAVTIFIFCTLVIFLLPNKAFAWFEYITSLIKIATFFLIIGLGFALLGGAGPNGFVRDGSTWTTFPPFKNGFFVGHTQKIVRSLLITIRVLQTAWFSPHGPWVTKSSWESWVERPRALASPWHERRTSSRLE